MDDLHAGITCRILFSDAQIGVFMKLNALGFAAAAVLLPVAASAQSSASLSTKAHYSFSLYTSQIDNYNSTDGSIDYGGTGNHSLMPLMDGSFGGGGTGAGGETRINLDASVSAPVNSSAYLNGAWFPLNDAGGNPLPIYHVSNLTEFATQLHVFLAYDFAASGMSNGDAGVSVIDLASFGVFCSSCAGLPASYFTGSDAFFAGDYYGAGTGAFTHQVSGNWDLKLTLAPFSTAELFATLSSNVTMIAQAAAVPEPSSWAMVLGGFALAGNAMRARRKAMPGWA